MNKFTYEYIEKKMQSCMDDQAHDQNHVYRVLYHALDIASYEENVNIDVLIAACLLHDIGRAEEFADPSLCHAQVGSEKAYTFLLESGWDECIAAHVRDCILTHRYRSEKVPASLEAKILFDADKLDVVGSIGIVRTLVYGTQLKHPLYEINDSGVVGDGSHDQLPTFFKEYKRKLEKLYDSFYTIRAEELAKECQSAAVVFYESLLKELQANTKRGTELLKQFID